MLHMLCWQPLALVMLDNLVLDTYADVSCTLGRIWKHTVCQDCAHHGCIQDQKASIQAVVAQFAQ